jgi:hypothetical protein
LAPSGGWPRAGRASKGPPLEDPGIPPVPPWPVPANAGAGGGSKGGECGNMFRGESGLPRGRHLRPRVPGREVYGRQTLRPHQKGNGDAPTGAGYAGGGLPVGGEKGGRKRRCLE